MQEVLQYVVPTDAPPIHAASLTDCISPDFGTCPLAGPLETTSSMQAITMKITADSFTTVDFLRVVTIELDDPSSTSRSSLLSTVEIL